MTNSIYYKQKFVSPIPVWAEIKEQMSSYFLSGALDDVMFPKWTEHCLRRFRKSSLKIESILLELNDYTACLPDDFDSMREVWLTTVVHSSTVQNPSACYYQNDCRIYEPGIKKCEDCFDDGTTTNNTNYMVVNKVTDGYYFSFERTFLLLPGNLHAQKKCGEMPSYNVSDTEHTFDIINNKIVTNFNSGLLHITYYSNAITEDGEQLIPDDFWVQDYIRKFITMKLVEKLINMATDESINILERKLQKAEKDQAEAFILAETNLKKETINDKVRKIVKSHNVNNKYNLPGTWNSNR